MKKIVLFVLTVLIFNVLSAQDLIIKKNGDEINAKIQELGAREIKYKKMDNPDGPLFSILKSEVFMIKYANGTKDVFDAAGNSNSNIDNNVSNQPAEQATVIIYRPNFGPAGSMTVYDVYADTKYLAKMKNGSYFSTKLDAGNVTFNATVHMKETLSVNLEPGKTYYIRCGVHSTMLGGGPSLVLAPEDIGLKETKRMRK